MARFVGRDNVRKRLAGLEEGRTLYADGAVRIESEEETLVVRPPFGLAHEGEYDRVELGPLLEALDADHVVAALLVRLGGYAVGVFEGERLVASKVGTRFVKGRHRKGGSSANRCLTPFHNAFSTFTRRCFPRFPASTHNGRPSSTAPR